MDNHLQLPRSQRYIYRSIISPPIYSFFSSRIFVAKEKRVKFVEPLIRRATVSFADMLRHTLKWTQEIAGGEKKDLNEEK